MYFLDTSIRPMSHRDDCTFQLYTKKVFLTPQRCKTLELNDKYAHPWVVMNFGVFHENSASLYFFYSFRLSGPHRARAWWWPERKRLSHKQKNRRLSLSPSICASGTSGAEQKAAATLQQWTSLSELHRSTRGWRSACLQGRFWLCVTLRPG